MLNRVYPIHAATLRLRLGGMWGEVKSLTLVPVPRVADGAPAEGLIETAGSGPGPIALVEVCPASRPGIHPETILVDGRPLPLDARRLLELALSDDPAFLLHHPSISDHPEG